jgi:hypothetical protein
MFVGSAGTVGTPGTVIVVGRSEPINTCILAVDRAWASPACRPPGHYGRCHLETSVPLG